MYFIMFNTINKLYIYSDVHLHYVDISTPFYLYFTTHKYYKGAMGCTTANRLLQSCNDTGVLMYISWY